MENAQEQAGGGSAKPGQQRIMILIGSMDVGGTETHLSRILPSLNTADRHLRVVCFRNGGVLVGMLREQGVEVIVPRFQPKLFKFKLLQRFLNLIYSVVFIVCEIRRFKPDVAHYFLPEAYMLGGFLSFCIGPRHKVMSRRSRNFYQQRAPVLRLERLLHRYMDVILTNSTASCIDLKNEGVPENKIILSYNGIDASEFVRATPDRSRLPDLDMPKGDFIITCVANLIPYKGHGDIVSALKLVSNRANKIELRPPRMLFVGDDRGIQAELEKQAAEAGVAHLLQFSGSRPDIPQILNASDMAILASHEEGMSNALLEYMCCALPIIATDVGGNRELLGDAGLLVAPQSPEDLAAAIFDLYTDERTARTLGRRARARVVSHFPLSASIDTYSDVYDALRT